uniref:Glycosyltransferase N-terminal domain-containing protein n=1 Tax=Chenopodium quinoa TaxID=63459 RepID=A0A803MAG2_CHEQI
MEGQTCYKDSKVAVLMVPFPAQGHLNQLLHLSNLITSYGIPVHYAGSSVHNRQAKLRLHGWNAEILSKIHFHDFNLPPYSSPPPKPDPAVHFPTHLLPLFDASEHLHEPVSQLLQQLSSKFRRVIVIHDCLMASVVQDVRDIPNAELYAFIPISAFTPFFNSWDKMPQKPFTLDSNVPKGIQSTEGGLTPRVTSFIVNQRDHLGFESGRIYNTSRVIEDEYIELLMKLP